MLSLAGARAGNPRALRLLARRDPRVVALARRHGDPRARHRHRPPDRAASTSGSLLASRRDPSPRPRDAQGQRALAAPRGQARVRPRGHGADAQRGGGQRAFRQEPDFLYLTGIAEPRVPRVVRHRRAPFVLVAPRQPTDMDVWCGPAPTPEELRARTGADIVYYEDEWDKALHAVEAREGQTVFVPRTRAARARRPRGRLGEPPGRVHRAVERSPPGAERSSPSRRSTACAWRTRSPPRRTSRWAPRRAQRRRRVRVRA